MALTNASLPAKRRILAVCVKLFLEQGYKNTSVSQIVDEADVARGSYLNLFPTKDKILLDLVETMFSGQFSVARGIADQGGKGRAVRRFRSRGCRAAVDDLATTGGVRPTS